MIGTRWYMYVGVHITHARCRTEEGKQNIIYIVGYEWGYDAETKIVYTSGCSPRVTGGWWLEVKPLGI